MEIEVRGLENEGEVENNNNIINHARILLLSLITCCTFSLYGQKIDVIGEIYDKDGTELVSATVVAIYKADSTMAGFSLTNGQGKFKISGLQEGKYDIQISYLGYNQKIYPITLTSDKQLYDMKRVVLTQADNELDEVIIEGESVPIVVKKDTLEYNAAAFEPQPNEVVEDLLRKMPGVEIEDDGTVIAQGEEVERVTVDGKEFFGNDPKIATKNLPAEAIDKVQFFDQKSDMAEFTGVDDGERTKTMNLELKESHKNGYFGNIGASYGTSSRYESTLSLNRFSPQTQMSFIGNLNNINKQGFSTGDYVSFMSSMGGFGRGRNSGISVNNGLSNGFVSTLSGGLNLNHDLSAKSKLSFNYFINDVDNTTDRISTAENVITGRSTIITEEDGLQESGNINHRFASRYDLEIDSSQDIRLTANVNLNRADLTSSNETILSSGTVVENQGISSLENEGGNHRLGGGILYRKKFGKKNPRSISLQLNYNDQVSDLENALLSTNEFFPEDEARTFTTNILQEQIQDEEQNTYQVRASYVQPLAFGKFLELNYRFQNINDDVIREVYDDLLGGLVLNSDLSNSYVRTFGYHRPGIAYHMNTDNADISIEGNLQITRLEGDLRLSGTSIVNNNVSFLPRFTYRYQFAGSKRLSLNYNTSVREPSLEQLQPIVDNSDPLNIYIGNPDLQNEYRHTMRLSFFNFDQFSFSNFFAFLNFNYSRNKIVNESLVDEQFVRTTRPINVENDIGLNSNISYGRPIRALGIKVEASTRLGYNKSILFINEVENTSNRLNSTLSFSIENKNKSNYDLALNSRWSYNTTQYSISSESDQSYNSYRYGVRSGWYSLDKFKFKSSFNYTVFNQSAIEENSSVPIWEASMSFYPTKDKKWEFNIIAFDILNKNLGISQVAQLNYIQTEEIISLGRYVLFGLRYRINQTKAGSTGGGRSFRGRRF